VAVGAVLAGVIEWLIETRRAQRAEAGDWRTAARLVSDELERLLWDLSRVIRTRRVPEAPLPAGTFLATSSWDEHRPVIARIIPDTDEGDELWMGLSRVMTTTAVRARPLLELGEPGNPIDPEFIDALRDGFQAAWEGYEALTGRKPNVPPLPAG
jgi:hypothetical protein